MKRLCVLVVCLWLGVGSGAAQAQIFFNPFKKAAPPPPPAERVSQLIAIIKSDADERKRTQAVEEIRDFDTKAFPEIVPILADIAQNDAKAGVRNEAITSLVRIRPVSAMAGQAIEHAASKDDHWRNRMNAQAALVRYRLAGYSSNMARTDAKPPAPPTTSQEPPLGDRPPIIYHDQTGKVIPAPKNLQGPVMGTPTSNPSAGKQPYAPIGPAVRPNGNPPGGVTTPGYPQASPGPVSVEPVFRNLNKPAEPGPLVFTPAAAPAGVPAIPTANPVGPSLDLPPLPVNQTPRTTTPALPAGRMEPVPRLVPTP